MAGQLLQLAVASLYHWVQQWLPWSSGSSHPLATWVIWQCPLVLGSFGNVAQLGSFFSVLGAARLVFLSTAMSSGPDPVHLFYWASPDGALQLSPWPVSFDSLTSATVLGGPEEQAP